MKFENKIITYGKQSKKEKNIIYVNEEDFQINVGKESFGIPLDELSKIERQKLDGKTLPELLSYDDFSLWWFIEPSIYPEFKKLINFTSKFLNFIEEKRPTEIIIKDDFNKLDIIKQICNNKQIEFNFSKIGFLKFKIVTKILESLQSYRYKKIFWTKIKKRIFIYKTKFKSIPKIDQEILFAVPTAYRRSSLNYKTGESERREFILQDIVDIINKKIIGIDIDYTFRGNPEILKERIDSELTWFPIDMLLSKFSEKPSNIFPFLKKYEKLISNPNFHHLFQFQKISLWKTLEFVFKKMKYSPYLPFYLSLLYSIPILFKNETPKVIFLLYETGPIAQALILISEKYGIKTIGIAHGTIDEYNPMYSYNRLRKTDDPYGFPIPNVTLVHGSFSKETLVKQGYPKEKFVIFGNPSYFNLKEIKSILAKKNLSEKYHIKKNNKVILFATEYLTEYYNKHGKYNYNSLMWRKLLENFGNSNEYTIILKPHPNENTSVYENILIEKNVNNARILQGDLFELIYISSVVIAVFSNVMTDALCLEKPVIRVKFDDVEHTVPYDKFGVVISSDLDGMVPEIHNILDNADQRKNLKKNLSQFLKEQNNIPSENAELILKKILE